MLDSRNFTLFFCLNGMLVTPCFLSGFFHNGRHARIFHTDGFTNINFLSHLSHFLEVWIILTGKEQKNCMVKTNESQKYVL